jgi:predicted nucleotide-binding protein
MARIAIIDDDMAMGILADSLRNRGHEILRIKSAAEALKQTDALATLDLVILDIIMPWPTARSRTDLAGNHNAGMEILRELRSQARALPILVYSATQDQSIVSALSDDSATEFVQKWGDLKLTEFIAKVNQMLGILEPSLKPRPFIVHGHNENAKLDLKNYLQNTMHLPEPIILHEQPSLGRTIIEKFEDYADETALVFVLLTKDDLGASASDPDERKHRARQNVIFEMGYFLGLLGRKSGRVILLYERPLELPSDLMGVIYIDISSGVQAAGEAIRLEVGNVK